MLVAARLSPMMLRCSFPALRLVAAARARRHQPNFAALRELLQHAFSKVRAP